MTSRRIVDTNLIIRHFVQDNERQAKLAAKLFAACDRGDVTVVILTAVLAECVFVLESFYKHSRRDIAAVLAQFISGPGVEIAALPIHLNALERYRSTKFHFVDCLIAAVAASEQVSVATFDRDLGKFHDVRVEID